MRECQQKEERVAGLCWGDLNRHAVSGGPFFLSFH